MKKINREGFDGFQSECGICEGVVYHSDPLPRIGTSEPMCGECHDKITRLLREQEGVETFEMIGGSRDGREFRFIAPFRPLIFSMDGHERYMLGGNDGSDGGNKCFSVIAPDTQLVIHKDENPTVTFHQLEVPDDYPAVTENVGANNISMNMDAELLQRCGELNEQIRDHAAAIAEKDAEIARLKAENARVKWQRDKLALAYCNLAHELMFPNDPAANETTLGDFGLRIVNGTVEEIGEKEEGE